MIEYRCGPNTRRACHRVGTGSYIMPERVDGIARDITRFNPNPIYQ